MNYFVFITAFSSSYHPGGPVGRYPPSVLPLLLRECLRPSWSLGVNPDRIPSDYSGGSAIGAKHGLGGLPIRRQGQAGDCSR